MKRTRSKGPVTSKKTFVDGIKFQSGLEAYTYRKLKEAGVRFEYEKRSFTIIDGFDASVSSWESLRKKFIPRKDRIRPITYKPDFTCPEMTWVIEVKGRANELFPMRWKLFKRHLKVTDQHPELFLPSNMKEVDIAVNWIAENAQ